MMRLGSEDRGTTLIELVAVMGLLLVVMGSILSAYMAGVRTEKAAEVRDVAMEDLRYSMARLTKDVRQAVSIEASSSTSRLAIQTLVNGVQRRVVFDVAGTELRRAVGTGSPVPIARGMVRSDVFCYDAPTCAAPSPTPGIELVRLALEVKPSQASAPPMALATDVQLRNLPSVS